MSYFFGRELQLHLNRPIGLIGSCRSGSPAQAWVSFAALEKDPLLKLYSDAYTKLHSAYTPEAIAAYQAKLATYTTDKAKWDQDFGAAYYAVLLKWNDAVAKAKAAGQTPRPSPCHSP